MDDAKKSGVDRRTFLKTTAASAVAAASAPAAVAQSPADKAAVAPAQAGAQSMKKERPHPGDIVIERPGSDFMYDVIKTLDLKYITTNPGSSFRSLHESIINYGGNSKPELLTCLHEEAAIAMAHG